MSDCTICEHSIFCPTWGRYKCTKHEIWVYNTKKLTPCEFYNEVKNKEEKKCHCETCEERGLVEDDS